MDMRSVVIGGAFLLPALLIASATGMAAEGAGGMETQAVKYVAYSCCDCSQSHVIMTLLPG